MTTESTEGTGTDAGEEGEPVVNVVVPEVSTKEPVIAFDVLATQGLTDVSEADLRGENVPEEVPVVPVVPVVEETAKPPVVEEKPAEKLAETPPAKVEPPPKGFVPLKAVQEAREENRQLRERLKVLEDKVLEPEVKPVLETIPEVRADFKVLTKDEFKELSEESPRDALVYMAELQDFEKAQRMTKEAASQKASREREVEGLFAESVKLMTEAIPDLFTEGSTAQGDLASFAETIGFTKDMFYLTNPETLVILPGETEPVYLGTQAASFIKMLADLRTKVGKPGDVPAVDQTALRKTIEAELRKAIETEVLTKIKTGGKPAFKSMGDVPSSDSEIPASKGVLTEAQYAALTPPQQKAYLSGE
jgi:hypothetical protein